MFGSRYRNPANRKELMGELMPLGKAYAIIAVMTHGPDLPTEITLHNERFQYKYFCPPPPTRKSEAEDVRSAEDKVRSALGMEYEKILHYCIAHLRRADGGLRPKGEDRAVGSMNLLAQGEDTPRLVARCANPILHRTTQNRY